MGSGCQGGVDQRGDRNVHQVDQEVQIPWFPIFQGDCAGDHVPRGGNFLRVPFCGRSPHPDRKMGDGVQQHYATRVHVGIHPGGRQPQQEGGWGITAHDIYISGNVDRDRRIRRRRHVNQVGC